MCRSSTDVVILVGGLGSRIKALFPNLPKPLIPVFNKPHLLFILNSFSSYNLNRFILSVGFKSKVFNNFFNVNRFFFKFKTLLISDNGWAGTGGALINVSKYLKSKYSLVFNGDSFFNFSIDDFILKSLKNKGVFLNITTVGLVDCYFNECGSIISNKQGNILRFLEKSSFKSSPYINTGFYILKNSSLKGFINCFFIEKKTLTDFNISIEGAIIPLLLKKFKFTGYPYKGFFVDTGTPSKYKLA